MIAKILLKHILTFRAIYTSHPHVAFFQRGAGVQRVPSLPELVPQEIIFESLLVLVLVLRVCGLSLRFKLAIRAEDSVASEVGYLGKSNPYVKAHESTFSY